MTKFIPNRAMTFATAWIAQNIEIGPFSWNDPPIYDGPIRAFRKDAAQAGFDETQLEQGIGAVPLFIANAYRDAIASWRGAHRFRAEDDPQG